MQFSEPAGNIVGPQWDWGDRMRKIRRSVAMLSQSEMAKLLGVKTPTYGAWEGGRNAPSLTLAYRVAKILEDAYPGRVSAGWVLGLDSIDAASEALLPRMDSNHQPCGWRFHSPKVLHANPSQLFYATPKSQ